MSQKCPICQKDTGCNCIEVLTRILAKGHPDVRPKLRVMPDNRRYYKIRCGHFVTIIDERDVPNVPDRHEFALKYAMDSIQPWYYTIHSNDGVIEFEAVLTHSEYVDWLRHREVTITGEKGSTTKIGT